MHKNLSMGIKSASNSDQKREIILLEHHWAKRGSILETAKTRHYPSDSCLGDYLLPGLNATRLFTQKDRGLERSLPRIRDKIYPRGGFFGIVRYLSIRKRS